MSEFKPSVQSIRQQNTITATGETQRNFLVTYVIGPHGPFSFEIPADQWSVAEVVKRMDDMAATINALPTGA